jgi:cytochrome b subunit of formate dehydrogenase
VRYFFGKAREPLFNRFTYWEKFDYLAIFLGMNTMGLTGLFLWFPEFFSTILPGYFINVAQVLHLYEAIMAVALKFVVHIMTTHLRPETFPLDRSIFDGKTTPEKMKKDHPGEWEHLTSQSSK